MVDVVNLDAVPYPHPALRWKCKEVAHVTPLVQEVVKKMFDIMYDYRGIGLAANQVGLPWRIFVTNFSGERDKPKEQLVFINPILKFPRPNMFGDFEGCISLPGLQLECKVPRYRNVLVEALDINGKPFRVNYGGGLPSRCVQHENDHLDGKLFVDHLQPQEKLAAQGWLDYLGVQYESLLAFGRFKSHDEEKAKLLILENYIQQAVA